MFFLWKYCAQPNITRCRIQSCWPWFASRCFWRKLCSSGTETTSLSPSTTCPTPHSSIITCPPHPHGVYTESSWGPRLFSPSIIRDEGSPSSAQLPCIIRLGFGLWGKGTQGGHGQKNREIKTPNNTFFYYVLCSITLWLVHVQFIRVKQGEQRHTNVQQGSLFVVITRWG